jgi:hypothetical protein
MIILACVALVLEPALRREAETIRLRRDRRSADRPGGLFVHTSGLFSFSFGMSPGWLMLPVPVQAGRRARSSSLSNLS